MLSLIKTFFNHAFLSLFCTQYLGAFNDNFFRTAMATFITYKVTTLSANSKSVIVALAVALAAAVTPPRFIRNWLLNGQCAAASFCVVLNGNAVRIFWPR